MSCKSRQIRSNDLYVRPSEVAPQAPVIQADVRASGDRLLDQEQRQERLNIIRGCVNFNVKQR